VRCIVRPILPLCHLAFLPPSEYVADETQPIVSADYSNGAASRRSRVGSLAQNPCASPCCLRHNLGSQDLSLKLCSFILQFIK
jgi:hypothetical protein